MDPTSAGMKRGDTEKLFPNANLNTRKINVPAREMARKAERFGR